MLSISGVVDTKLFEGMLVPTELMLALGVGLADLRPIWGIPGVNQDVWDAHNPTMLAKRLRGVELFVTSGTGFLTVSQKTRLGTGAVEFALWQGHRTFLGALTTAGVPFTARITQGGSHDWPDSQSSLLWGLPKAIAAARR